MRKIHTKIMGIVNVTPDSFFDQGKNFSQEEAQKHAKKLAKEGADWLDIGGESTRPGAKPVPEKEELNRVLPLIRFLSKNCEVPLSIDTKKPSVAKAALLEGAKMINDVTGFFDPEMCEIAKETKALMCVMHMQGNPQTMQIHPHYEDGIIPYLLNWFEKRIDLLLSRGIQPEQIILDPGIGFGKTVDQNLEILHNLAEIRSFGFPVLLGISRKSFIGHLLNYTSPNDRLFGTLALNIRAALEGIDILRVHDVKEHNDALKILRS